MQCYKSIIIVIASINLIFSFKCFAASGKSQSVYIDRYIKVASVPTADQADLLQQLVYIHFPSQIKTVGQAIHYLLNDSGYALADITLSAEVATLFNCPLPKVQRYIGPMTLTDALKTLSGNTFQLLVDPVHRLVSYQVKHIDNHDYHLHNPAA